MPKRFLEGYWALKEPWTEALALHGFDVAAALDLTGEAQPAWLEEDVAHWRTWLAEGGHADMAFMGLNEQARRDSRLILSEVVSAIVVLVPYAAGRKVRGSAQPGSDHPTHSLPDTLSDTPAGERPLVESVARYARGDDYHKVLKKRLDAAATLLVPTHPGLRWRAVIDSIPFFDRAHAREAGLGFVGKNTMFLRPGMGSYFFIATLLTNVPTASLATEARPSRITDLSCGDCRACLDACPTGALPRPYYLDAGKCLSYLTIENRETMPEEALPYFADTLFGCDICQEVCPYNFTTPDLVRIAQLRGPRATLTERTARELAAMTQAEYETWFGGTALTRAKYGGLVRNALCFLHANSDPMLPALLTQRAQDPDPLIASTVQQLKGFQ